MKLAIVGSTSLDGNPSALQLIRQIFDRYQPTTFISGGAVGIDTMAEEEARRRGILRDIRRPRVPSWGAPGGFRERNQEIADRCDVLVRIVASTSKTYGSGWTRDRAAAQGKHTEEYKIHVEGAPRLPLRHLGA